MDRERPGSGSPQQPLVRLEPWIARLGAPPGGSWRKPAAVASQRSAARALLLARARAGAGLEAGFEGPEDFQKDSRGAPLPRQGWHWCVSHAAGWVGSLLAPLGPLGLDLEPENRPISRALQQRLGALIPPDHALDDAHSTLELWVRLEAAAKLLGEGLGVLARIRFGPRQPDGRQEAWYGGRRIQTRALFVQGLALAAALEAPDFELSPRFVETPDA